jgi:DNA-binding MarR family transcriptional regulator
MSPTPDELPLDPALSFLQRIWELNHALERLSSRMERTLSITASQRFIVRCVGKYPGMTAGQLATILHLDRGSVSAALRRLENQGLLQRRRDSRDRRRITLGLTLKGRAMDVARSGTVESAVVHLLESSSNSEIEVTRSVLRRLSAALGEEEGATGQRLDPKESGRRRAMRAHRASRPRL